MNEYLKLLICYDISEKQLNESSISDEVIKEIKNQYYWIHLQKSVWVVLSKINVNDMYTNLLQKIDENTETFLSVIDITNQDICYNSVKDWKNKETNTELNKDEESAGLDFVDNEINTSIDYTDVLNSQY